MRFGRTVTPRVEDGRVQRKNRHAQSPSIWSARCVDAFIVTQRPGPHHKHVVRSRDVAAFLDLLPDREHLLAGLNGILLARASDCSGWYDGSVVAICAWPREIVVDWNHRHFAEHEALLDRLGVPHCELEDGGIRCDFTESTARAYLLLHVLVHELGHHHDRITTRTQRDAARGEPYAERYAVEREDLLWEKYCAAFGL